MTQNLPSSFIKPPSAEALHRLLKGELSMRSRLGHVALLLGASAMITVIGSLWATEPALPVRTQLGFAILVAIGLSWVTFSLWVLTCRRPLFARHRIIAGRMAVVFTSLFMIGAFVVGFITGGIASYVVGSVGFVMVAAAIAVLVQAHRTFAWLTERRAILERELGRSAK